MESDARMSCTVEANRQHCTCLYPGCGRKGRCFECITYHRRNGELPGCLFPPEVERTYDRSIRRFVELYGTWSGRQ